MNMLRRRSSNSNDTSSRRVLLLLLCLVASSWAQSATAARKVLQSTRHRGLSGYDGGKAMGAAKMGSMETMVVEAKMSIMEEKMMAPMSMEEKMMKSPREKTMKMMEMMTPREKGMKMMDMKGMGMGMMMMDKGMGMMMMMKRMRMMRRGPCRTRLARQIRRIVDAAFEALFVNFDIDAVLDRFAPDFIQHNLNLPTGAEALTALVPVLENVEGLLVTNLCTLVDGNFVAYHTTYENAATLGFGGPVVVSFEIFRVDVSGRVAEHWDSVQMLLPANPSGHSMVDGTTFVQDRDLTETNRGIVLEFVHRVLIGGNVSALSEFVSTETFVQHSPYMEDGVEAMAAEAGRQVVVYMSVGLVVAEGNFVLVGSLGLVGDVVSVIYDLFRLVGGKIVEHWDVVQPVPEDPANDNGVFQSNLQIANAILDAVLISYDVETAARLLAPDYIQHPQTLPTGRQPVLNKIPMFEQVGFTVTTFRTLVDGDLVAYHNVFSNADRIGFGSAEIVAFDVFRINEFGLVAEHWDGVQALALQPNPSDRTMLDGPTEVTDLDQTETNRQIVTDFVYTVLIDGNFGDITNFVAEMLIQHNPNIGDGVGAFLEAVMFAASVGQPLVYKSIGLVVAEGNFVLVGSLGSVGDVDTIFFDLFRLDYGLIVEHWDVVQPVPDVSLNDNGVFRSIETVSDAAFDAIFVDYDAEVASRLLDPDYIQHNLAVPTGAAAILEFIPILQLNGVTTTRHRTLVDGDLVAYHVTYENADVFGFGPTVVTFEVFRVENECVVEHWDNIQMLLPPNPSDRTMTDGPTEVTDLDRTEMNREIVLDFFNTVAIGRDVAAIPEFISPDTYIQHNPNFGDGTEPLVAAFSGGSDLVISEIGLVVAEGNFVLVGSLGASGLVDFAFYDLFRLENGLIVEHWDVIQPIPDDVANDNGKF